MNATSFQPIQWNTSNSLCLCVRLSVDYVHVSVRFLPLSRQANGENEYRNPYNETIERPTLNGRKKS